MTKYWTVQEYADKYRVSPRVVRRMIRNKELTAKKVGREYRIPMPDGASL